MFTLTRPPSLDCRHNPLAAACVAALFAFSAPAAIAAPVTWTVNSCDDANSGSGTTGTLRYAAANAASGDTIDLTTLTCGIISLQTGAVNLGQTSITLNGPGIGNLAISGNYYNQIEHDRVLNHTGTGTLAIHNLTVSFGYLDNASGYAKGGGIYSAGTAYLDHVGVYACTARTASSGRAQGGGVFGKAGIVLKYSTLSGNQAVAAGSTGAYGGGAYTPGAGFTALYSTISNNSASGNSGFGGGIWAYQSATIISSTISGNTAHDNGGGIYNHHFSSNSGHTLTLIDSTISGNNAGYYTGGVSTNAATVHVYNSSIVVNTANRGRSGASPPFSYYAPGIATRDDSGAVAVTLQSSLLANNTYSSIEYDLSVPKRSSTTVTFSGANNLVRATFAAVPSDTIKLSCPLLGPLRNNGGATKTHALLSRSPGIDQGNNNANLTSDQRGPPFARVSGSAADIGAFEVQQGDALFSNGFDGCPTLF